MKPIRVALSGSGFKFPVHVGALTAIRDAGYTPIEYAGTSGGSIVAALAACGMLLEDMKDMTLENDWNSMLSLSWGSLMRLRGYCDGNTLLDWLDEHTKSKTFSELPVWLTIMSSDVVNAVPFEWSPKTTPDKLVALAARASASIPFIYTPVEHDSVKSVDGGVVNNLPVMRLIQDAVLRVGIDLVSKETPMYSSSPLDIAAQLVNMMLDSAESTQALFGQHSGAQIAYIETGFASGLDRNMSLALRQRLFQAGYDETMKLLPQ
jgi:NTE family protein